MRSAPHARHADVTITIAYTVDARRMLDEADERWIAEHGFATDNPLLDQIEHAAEMPRCGSRTGVDHGASMELLLGGIGDRSGMSSRPCLCPRITAGPCRSCPVGPPYGHCPAERRTGRFTRNVIPPS